MKFIKYITIFRFTAVLLAFGVGFYACNTDNDIIPKTLEEYKAELSYIVTSEKEVVGYCVMGYDKGNFRIDTILYLETTAEYMDVLNDADSIMAIDGLTIADVMFANDLISRPGKTFNDNTYNSDRRPLQEVIVYSDTLRVNTPEGTEPGMAPAEALARFGDAISVAKYWRSSSITIDRQVTAEVDSLNSELEVFENAIIK